MVTLSMSPGRAAPLPPTPWFSPTRPRAPTPESCGGRVGSTAPAASTSRRGSRSLPTAVALTATSRTSATDGEYVTAVYDAATGAELWRAVHNGSRAGDDVAGGVVIADGAVVVTGKSAEQPAGSDYGTIAYELETGAVRWTRLANSAAHFADSALDIAASADGDSVYVTGYVIVPRGEIQPFFKIEPGTAMTVAYETDSGTRSWVAHHNESGIGSDVAVDVEVGADRVYLGGTFVFSGVYLYPAQDAKPYAYDFGVVAYPA